MRHLIPFAVLLTAGCATDGISTTGQDVSDAIDAAQAEGVDVYDLTQDQREAYRLACTLGVIFAPLVEGTTSLDFGSVTQAGCDVIASFDEEPEG